MVYTYKKADLKSTRRDVYIAPYGVAIVPLALALTWILAIGVQIPHLFTKVHALNEKWKDGGQMHVTTPPVA